jgi:hypothetical protein
MAVEYARRHAMRVRRGEYLNGSDADATAFVCRCLNAGGGLLYFDDAEGLYRALLAGKGAFPPGNAGRRLWSPATWCRSGPTGRGLSAACL